MHEFPDLLPWEEMTAMIKRHEEQITRQQDAFDGSTFSADRRMYDMEKQLEMLTTVVHEHAETRELVSCLEKQIDALEKVVADLTEASLPPVKAIQPVLDERFVRAFKQLTREQRKMLSEAQKDDCIF